MITTRRPCSCEFLRLSFIMDSQPPAKRPRSDPDEGAAPPECIRSSTLWFEDGSIVLEAERVRFKVYKGILAANSAIFRDMFALAHAQEGELVDGCPVLCLGDKSQDLAHVLEALHDSRRWIGDTSEDMKAMPIPVLAAFLRLGRKYEIDHVRQQAVKRLATAFPSDLDGCLSAYSKPEGLIIKLTDYCDLLYLVNIIRENELLVHLPMALLGCVSRDHQREYSIFLPSLDTQQPILPYKDIELCHKASIKLVQLQHTEIFSWTKPWGPAPTCGIPECEVWRQEIHRDLPGPDWFMCVDWKDNEGRFCEECRPHARGKYREAQEKIYGMLPSLFDLPPWEELREKWSK